MLMMIRITYLRQSIISIVRRQSLSWLLLKQLFNIFSLRIILSKRFHFLSKVKLQEKLLVNNKLWLSRLRRTNVVGTGQDLGGVGGGGVHSVGGREEVVGDSWHGVGEVGRC